MTRPLGEGLPSPVPPFAMSRRHVTPAAAGREAAQDCRNQMITDFFKPVLSQEHGHKDRTLLSSPDKGNVKDEGMGLSVLHTEGFERNSSSPKKVRRQRCQTKHQISPVIGVFGQRIEEKDSVNMAECAGPWVCCSYPKVVIQKLLVTAGSQMRSLTKKEKTA
ncbi:SLF2 protein, partial [Acrocephalus arundinaceus]|nr:SLF2 protein [Acrocephalus arundinaceus]